MTSTLLVVLAICNLINVIDIKQIKRRLDELERKMK